MNHIKSYDENSHSGLVRHILIRTGFTTGQIMVCVVINGSSIPKEDELVKKLLALSFSNERKIASIMVNINREKTNVILGKKCRVLYGTPYIEDYIGEVKYRIQPLSFYQVNPVQTEKLYNIALDYAGLTGNETVWDLYCGIGTISLFLAKKAKKVYGVEIVPEAIEDAVTNAKLNGIDNAEFYVGKAEEILPEKYDKENVHADVIVVDPPRKGCDEALLDTMVKMAPERIVYVSCDSATLARDLKFLVGNGYEVKKVQGVDQFCHSGHVETVELDEPRIAGIPLAPQLQVATPTPIAALCRELPRRRNTAARARERLQPAQHAPTHGVIQLRAQDDQDAAILQHVAHLQAVAEHAVPLDALRHEHGCNDLSSRCHCRKLGTERTGALPNATRQEAQGMEADLADQPQLPQLPRLPQLCKRHHLVGELGKKVQRLGEPTGGLLPQILLTDRLGQRVLQPLGERPLRHAQRLRLQLRRQLRHATGLGHRLLHHPEDVKPKGLFGRQVQHRPVYRQLQPWQGHLQGKGTPRV